MDLFNKYKNKDFIYLTNIINHIIHGYGDIKKENVIDILTQYGTFEEVIKYITEDSEENIFKVSKTKLTPKQNNEVNEVPVVLSYYEKAWLYAVLNDEKARLFLDDEIINNLKNILEKQNAGKPYPMSNNDIFMNKLNDKPQHHYTDEEIAIFRQLVDAVEKHKYITITNNAFTGQVYENSKLIPYKIEYNYKQDTFSVTCLNEAKMEIIRVFFLNIKDIAVNEEIKDYKTIQRKIEELLNKKRANTPITIKILNKNNLNAFHRCSYALSHYNKITYKENDSVYMDIEYYDFQLNDIITAILQMGKFVQVISPEEIVDKIKNIIAKKALKYGIK